MLGLNRRLAAEFMAAHPGVAVHVAGGGTAVGVADLTADRADLCAASRPFTSEEVEAVFRAFGTLGLRYLVARDAIAVVVHPTNAVRDLTPGEIRGLFTGRVRSWADVGGPPESVVPVLRTATSGTHRFFADRLLGGELPAPDAEVVVRTQHVVAAVAANPGAVGYVALPFAGDLGVCRLDGVAPDRDAIESGRYPLSRYLSYVSPAPPVGAVREFVDWALEANAQRIVASEGFIAIWDPRTARVPVTSGDPRSMLD
jgi:phosphate transport system substrate-binding protein